METTANTYRIAIVFLLSLLDFSPLHSQVTVLSDSFSDGSFTGNSLTPTWTSSQPGTNPWSVTGTEQAVIATGNLANDAFIINFGASSGSGGYNSSPYTITNGVFDLSFDIKFNSSTVGGTNRFYVTLRDSTVTNGNAGYRFYLANGTNANAYLCRIDLSGTSAVESTLDSTLNATAYTFSTTSYSTVRFTKDTNGLIQVLINGTVYFSATDSTYNKFDTLNLVTRATDASQIQYFDNILLTTIPESSTILMLGLGCGVFLIILVRKKMARRICMTSLCLTLLTMISHAEVVLLSDDFADGDFSQNPKWISMKGNSPWKVVDGAIVASGKVIFDTLSTTDFAAITDGVFHLKLDVKFASDDKTGNNRFFIRLRNSHTISSSENPGYEVVIARGTNNNSMLGIIGGVTLDGKIKSAPYEFPLDKFTTVEWTRTADGTMKVTVDGNLYFEAKDNQFQNLNQLIIGTRAFTPSNDPTSSKAMVHYFDNIVLKK